MYKLINISFATTQKLKHNFISIKHVTLHNTFHIIITIDCTMITAISNITMML